LFKLKKQKFSGDNEKLPPAGLLVSAPQWKLLSFFPPLVLPPNGFFVLTPSTQKENHKFQKNNERKE
jgi:hypothetical protein